VTSRFNGTRGGGHGWGFLPTEITGRGWAAGLEENLRPTWAMNWEAIGKKQLGKRQRQPRSTVLEARRRSLWGWRVCAQWAPVDLVRGVMPKKRPSPAGGEGHGGERGVVRGTPTNVVGTSGSTPGGVARAAIQVLGLAPRLLLHRLLRPPTEARRCRNVNERDSSFPIRVAPPAGSAASGDAPYSCLVPPVVGAGARRARDHSGYKKTSALRWNSVRPRRGAVKPAQVESETHTHGSVRCNRFAPRPTVSGATR